MSAEDEEGTTGEATVQAGAKDWEQGQIRIFSKMVSLMLGRALVSIPDDLKDGLVLENLVEKLSNKKTGINFEDGDTGRMATVARLNKLVVCFLSIPRFLRATHFLTDSFSVSGISPGLFEKRRGSCDC